MPTVSIAMPVYNGERYVAQAIESMLGQTFRDFEFVISDNASNDGTEALCRRWLAPRFAEDRLYSRSRPLYSAHTAPRISPSRALSARTDSRVRGCRLAR